MKPQFDHSVLSSLYLWLDNKICSENQAIISGRNQIFSYHESFDIPQDMNAYYTSTNQFYVGDLSSPTYVSGDGNIYYQNTSGSNKVIFDTNKGRILMQKSISNENSLFSGSFLQKEINLYMTSETEEQIILRNEFFLNSGQSYSEYMSELSTAKYMAPCIFINNNFSLNKGFSLGGQRETSNNISLVIFANNNYQLEGLLSILRDSKDKCFGLIDESSFPYGEYWHCKSGNFDYNNFILQNKIQNVYIKNSESYKLKDAAGSLVQKVSKDLMIGYCDLELSSIR